MLLTKIFIELYVTNVYCRYDSNLRAMRLTGKHGYGYTGMENMDMENTAIENTGMELTTCFFMQVAKALI